MRFGAQGLVHARGERSEPRRELGTAGRGHSNRRKVARPAGLEPATSWFVVAEALKTPITTTWHPVDSKQESDGRGAAATAIICDRLLRLVGTELGTRSHFLRQLHLRPGAHLGLFISGWLDEPLSIGH